MSSGFASFYNSTSAPLPAAATFTGVAEGVAAYSCVSVVCFCGGNSATLFLDMGTNTAAFEVTKVIPLDLNGTHSECYRLEGAYIRARLVNDVGATLSPRLQIVYHTSGSDTAAATEVTVVASALPAGAATEASLAAASAKLPASLGQKAAAGSLSVVQATSSPFDVNLAAGAPYRNLSLQGTGQVVKASAGVLRGVGIAYIGILGNVFVKLYDKATAPTTADTPIVTLILYPGARAVEFAASGIAFASGLGIRASAGPADNDSGAVAANTLLVEWLAYS